MKKILHPMRPISFVIYIAAILSSVAFTACSRSDAQGEDTRIHSEIERLLGEMTLNEKLGQLNLVVGQLHNTGPTVRTTESDVFDERIRRGEITGIFNIHGANYIRRLQRIALEESRLGIPLLIGADVIHGFKTVFPIPLGEAASWDLELMERTAAAAASEASAGGITWTFAPMVDLCRDARWGRVAEGAGEDPLLASRIAAARVWGFQGERLSDPHTLAACVKHFAGYGAPEGGLEYNTVDMSEHRFRSDYLPPYKAGIDAGAATVMTAFNELNGIPATGNGWLLRDILREEWGFGGMIVSDWQSISEMVDHGFVADRPAAARKAIMAGCDMDMMADAYFEDLPNLIAAGLVEQEFIDAAVRRVLSLKFKLGLFDHAYAYADSVREANEIRTPGNRALAREAARKSIVLLQNNENLLPLDGSKRVALIGPFAEDRAEHNGTWSFFGEPKDVVSLAEGFRVNITDINMKIASGCGFYDRNEDLLREAVELARQSEVVCLALGETALMNGEAGSRTRLGLPEAQQELLEAVTATGVPTVLLLTHGRPMELSAVVDRVDAILACWTLGSEAGNAIADVVFGSYNPSGRLPVSFPRHIGQVPIYYSRKATGRRYEPDTVGPLSERVYRARYIDEHVSPLFPFGYGLSYTRFEYSDLKISDAQWDGEGELAIELTVKNDGLVDGTETVQLYLRDPVASVTRPIRELKDFQRVSLAKGEGRRVRFVLSREDLSFYDASMRRVIESGSYEVYVGPDAESGLRVDFDLHDTR